ncbi:FAD-binding oxidoreductase [Hyphomicrobium sp. CS1GBMeth3]|uniref:NAD(P)/FAD-dependent oxidoreductase n=1 Tax=Hyphomicrobium sp. CS1GBMeth3 TaxID=1892845 RepID=UPI0009305A78|nr:FAD-binding oxidoreductase [Hyphomicrobium sp. CS1GBMeth3]
MSATHINSYYAATANDDTRYPALRGTITADVCIVGGGFSGIATALSLAERGYKVVVLEAQRVGWGASGRNGGQMIAGISGEHRVEKQLGEAGRKLLSDIRYLGNDIIEDRVSRHQIRCDLKRGWMEVAARPRHMEAMRAYVEERRAAGDGDGLELVEPGDMRGVIGSELYHGAMVDRRSGHLHPLNLCLGEARAAAALGVEIFEESPVTEVVGGSKPYAVTANGRVDAASIVLAGIMDPSFQTGPLHGLLFPTGSYIVATEPLPESIVSKINPQDLAVADSNVVLDYFRLSADKRLLFGGRCNYSNRDPRDIRATLRPRMVEVFPQLADVTLDYAWGGKIDIVLTRVPAIGRREPNVYYMQGYCGHGVNTTHIAGQIVAEAISGTMEKLDLFEKIRHIRLPVGQFLGNQLLALGMLYYRLKDLV